MCVLHTRQEALAGLSARHARQAGALPAVWHSGGGWVDQNSRYRGSCSTIFKLNILFQTRFCLVLWTKCPHYMCGLNLPKALLVSYTSILIQRCEGIWYVLELNFLFSFFWTEFNFDPAEPPCEESHLAMGGIARGLLQNCFGPPTCVDTARVILTGGLRNPGFLCICGSKGSHVAYGKLLHLRLPHLLQGGWCELSRWNLLHPSQMDTSCLLGFS